MSEVTKATESIPVSRARAQKIGRPTVVLVHEAWGRREGFRQVQENLNTVHVSSMAVDLPIENPGKSFNDYAKIVAEEMKRHNITKAILVGASLGGDTIAWVPSSTPGVSIEGMVFSSAPLQDVTVSSFSPEKLALNEGVEKNTDDFKKGRRPMRWFNQAFGIHDEERGFSYFPKDAALKVFYNKCPPAVQAEAVDQLRHQWRSKHEPMLPHFPVGIPTICLWGRYDNAVTEGWCRHRAEDLIGTELVITESDHTYQRCDPDGMTEHILSLIK